MSTNTSKVIYQLYNAFIEVYNQWPDSGSEAYARQILEHDVLMIGSYFGAVDPIGKYVEFALLAESVTELRLMQSTIKTNKIIENLIASVMEEIKGKSKEYTLPIVTDGVATMVDKIRSVPLVEELLEREIITIEHKQCLYQSMIDLANLFIMRDGVITDKELKAITEFEKILSEASPSF